MPDSAVDQTAATAAGAEQASCAAVFRIDSEQDLTVLGAGMELAEDVPNGHGGYAYRDGEAIDGTVVQRLRRLKELGVITTVKARPRGMEMVESVAGQMQQAFDIIDQVLCQENQAVMTAVEILRNHQGIRQFKEIVQRNLRTVYSCFSPKAIQHLNDLQQHHPGSGNHSIVAGLNEMAIAKALGLGEAETIQRVMAVIQHDIGKSRVKLSTLNWPGALDRVQWQEMQLHSLFGFKLLYHPDQPEEHRAAFTALLHHEWYAQVPGKGYGGLTTFRKYLKKQMGIDMGQVLARLGPDGIDTAQQAAIVDMVAALEEIRSYKKRIGPFKVLVIMVFDALHGHFNPRHFETWYQVYRREHPHLLPRNFCVALPREIEIHNFAPPRVALLPKSRHLLTLEELERVGLTARELGGATVDKVRRCGGMPVREAVALGEKAAIDVGVRVVELGIQTLKKRIARAEQRVGLQIFRRWVSHEKLVEADLLSSLVIQGFSPEVIREEGGIALERLMSRGGVHHIVKRLGQLGLDKGTPHIIHLPAYEHRLTPEALDTLGLLPLLEKKGVEVKSYGLRVDQLSRLEIGLQPPHLAALGVAESHRVVFTPDILELLGYQTETRIFYDMLVVEEIDGVCKAKVAFVREGDQWKDLKTAAPEKLDPLQQFLVETIGVVEMDFSPVIDLPDLSHIQPGPHWTPTPAA
ncbi:MAG: hypothetical protein HQL82_04250 [Magnetococcales bacterium]|nr:hypothetical protein [Magnetococcales bacterium]